ncbi:MAG: FAD-dependent oxidoreductase, partial [Flectobacillus sp.]|nr:FAD-dependent oxidoreductase [Flectobacillus sp.]
MSPNIPKTNQKRVVIVGAGFGGLKLAQTLKLNNDFQVVLIDRNNYHQFQPLFYQVATAGL